MNIKRITIAAALTSVGMVMIEETIKEYIQRKKEIKRLTSLQHVADIAKAKVSQFKEGTEAKLDLEAIFKEAGFKEKEFLRQGEMILGIASYYREYTNYDVQISEDGKSLNFTYKGE